MILLLAGCNGEEIVEDDYEPNGSVESPFAVGALPLEGDVELNLVLLPQDKDCFRISPLPPMRKVKVVLTLAEDKNVFMNVYHGAKQKAEGPTRKYEWNNTKLAGAILIEVDGTIEEPTRYTLLISDEGEVTDDKFEPNDDRKSAKELPRDDLMAMNADWFKVPVPDMFEGELTVKTKGERDRGLLIVETDEGRPLHEDNFKGSVSVPVEKLQPSEKSLVVGVIPAGTKPFAYTVSFKKAAPDVTILLAQLKEDRKAEGSKGKVVESALRLSRTLAAEETKEKMEEKDLVRAHMIVGLILLHGGKWDDADKTYAQAEELGSNDARDMRKEIKNCREDQNGYDMFLKARDAFDVAQLNEDQLDEASQLAQDAQDEAKSESVKELIKELIEQIKNAG